MATSPSGGGSGKGKGGGSKPNGAILSDDPIPMRRRKGFDAWAKERREKLKENPWLKLYSK